MLPIIFVYFLASFLPSTLNAENVDTVKFLQMYGYIPSGSHQISAESMTEAVLRMQKMAGIRQTGIVDERTKRMMNTPRCGSPDVETDNVKRYRSKRGAAVSIWKKKLITYGIQTPPSYYKLSLADIRRAARQAADQWSELADIQIIETSIGAKPDIKISVERDGYHNKCYYPFQFGTLAHGFRPPFGDIHINEIINFVMTNYTERFGENSLYSVIAHEMGHALGFDHNEETDSVMFAYDAVRPWKFTEKDRYYMQISYGSKKPKHVPLSTTPSPPPKLYHPKQETDSIKAPDICEIENPVIVNYRGEFFVFKSLWVWRISGDWRRKIAGPVLISTMFVGLPSPIQTSVVVDGNLWVFVDDKIYVFNANRMIHAPMTLRDLGIDKKSINLAYEWHYFKPAAVYLWKDEIYWRLDEKSYYRKIDERYPRNISLNWAKVPKDVSSAFNFENEVHFVRNDMIYRMNSSRSVFDVEDGYPVNIRSFFKFCKPRVLNHFLSSCSHPSLIEKWILIFLTLNFL